MSHWEEFELSKEQVKDFSELDEIVLEATGRRIKFLVKEEGISQSQLADILGRDIKTISNYYCGKSLPDKVDLILLSRILGVPYDEILVFKGDVEGYQRIQHYYLTYDEENETITNAINRSKKHSKLFNPHSKGSANIRSLEEAGFCLDYFTSLEQKDIRKRMMDALLSGRGVNDSYMHHIYENYIWRKLSDEQKAICKAQFAYDRAETEKKPDPANLYKFLSCREKRRK
ncbi:helix-turn-helix domain-containing protein (plasmid) [Priestia megaterium]|uniref:Helix-turn-helix domain-containing protein n=1 Tax=Priestia megaterium TaxID=1404 RepID=A0A6M6E4R7_PRIMG|nr:helix-turn-helix domain-containing protein [Priestia megaterium]